MKKIWPEDHFKVEQRGENVHEDEKIEGDTFKLRSSTVTLSNFVHGFKRRSIRNTDETKLQTLTFFLDNSKKKTGIL